MYNLLFAAVIFGAGAIYYWLTVSDQKWFVDKLVTSLNSQEKYKTDKTKIYIVGTSTRYLRAISVYSDEIVISSIDVIPFVTNRTFDKSQIDSIVITSNYFKILPNNEADRTGVFLSSITGVTEMGIFTLRHPNVTLLHIFRQNGTVDELRRSLVVAGFNVVDKMPEYSKGRKIMVGVAVFLLAVTLFFMVAIMRATA